MGRETSCGCVGGRRLPEVHGDLVALGLPVVEELEEGQRSQLGPRGLVLHLVGLEWLASLRVLLVLLLLLLHQ